MDDKLTVILFFILAMVGLCVAAVVVVRYSTLCREHAETVVDYKWAMRLLSQLLNKDDS